MDLARTSPTYFCMLGGSPNIAYGYGCSYLAMGMVSMNVWLWKENLATTARVTRIGWVGKEEGDQ
jgi:hypothetical protein